MTRWLASAMLTGAILCPRAAGQIAVGTGAIQGTVTDEKGNPVPAVFVTYQRVPYDPADTAPGSAGALTDAKGAFSFTGLPPATFVFCARANPNSRYVEPCEWTLKPTAVTLGKAQRVTALKISLEVGTVLKVRVDDPKRLLAAPDAVGGKLLQTDARTDDGLLHHLRLRSKDGGGQDFELVVPKNVAMRLHVYSNEVNVKDENDQAVGASTNTLVQTDGSAVTKVLRFRVE